MKHNFRKLLVRAAILLVLAFGSILSIAAMEGFQSAGIESAGLDAAVQQDIPVISIQDSHGLTVTVTASNPAGTYVPGDTLYLKFGFTPTTLTGGNLIVNFTTGGSGEITPFENATMVGLTYTIPTGFGMAPNPGLFVNSSLAPFNVSGFSLAEGASLTSGGNAITSVSVAPGKNVSDNVDIMVDPGGLLDVDTVCPPIPAFTPTGTRPEAPNYICAIPNYGEPVISWRNDERADWYHIWVGRIGTDTTPFYQAVDEWFSVAPNNFDYPQASCSGLTCTAKLGGINYVFAQGGTFQVWMEAYDTDNNQYSTGGSAVLLDPDVPQYDHWNGPAEFNLAATRPGTVSAMTITADSEGKITLNWEASAGSTWYAVWLGTAPREWEPKSFFWIDAVTAGCINGGKCWVRPGTQVLNFVTGVPSSFNVTLENDEYIYYVGSWGPGGFSDAGEYEPDGGYPPLEMWATGPQFTVTDGVIGLSG